MTTKHMGVSFTYLFSPEDYSMVAAFDLSAKQFESGGSWLLNFSASDHHLTNPTPIIPAELAGTYGEYEKVKTAKLFSAGFGGGFGYNLILFEDYYISLLAMINYANQFIRYEKIDGEANSSRTGALGHFKIGLGYNGEKFLAGVTLLNDTSTYEIETVETSFSTIEGAFFVGTRFKF